MPVNLTWIEVAGDNVQAAVDDPSLVNGGVVYMPLRQYNLSAPVTINRPNITILGDGPGATIVTRPNGFATPVFIIEKSGCSIEGLRITQLGIPIGGTGVGIQIGSASEIVSGTSLKNLLLDSLPNYGLYLPGFSFGSFKEANERWSNGSRSPIHA